MSRPSKRAKTLKARELPKRFATLAAKEELKLLRDAVKSTKPLLCQGTLALPVDKFGLYYGKGRNAK